MSAAVVVEEGGLKKSVEAMLSEVPSNAHKVAAPEAPSSQSSAFVANTAAMKAEEANIDAELGDLIAASASAAENAHAAAAMTAVLHAEDLDAPTNPLQWRTFDKDARQHCPVKGCSQFYVRHRNLEQHIITAHGPEHLASLDGPVEIDDSPKPFLCPVDSCGCRYVRKGDLKVHFLKKHRELEPLFPDLLRSKSSKDGKKHACPVPDCKCGYMRYGDLKSHFISHHKDRLHEYPEMTSEAELPSICRVPNCSIRCTNAQALETHMKLFHPEVVSKHPQAHLAETDATHAFAPMMMPMMMSGMMPMMQMMPMPGMPMGGMPMPMQMMNPMMNPMMFAQQPSTQMSPAQMQDAMQAYHLQMMPLTPQAQFQ